MDKNVMTAIESFVSGFTVYLGFIANNNVAIIIGCMAGVMTIIERGVSLYFKIKTEKQNQYDRNVKENIEE